MKTRVLAMIAIGLWVATAVVAVLVFVRGHTEAGSDGRQAIVLTESEKNLVLTEMRTMLVSVQGVVDGITKQDMKRVAAAARQSGAAAAHAVPPSLMAKLPLQFKQLGNAAHQGFDEIVVGAESGEPEELLLVRLGERLNNCIACHATFRLEAEKPAAP
jgi:hypothetical protein